MKVLVDYKPEDNGFYIQDQYIGNAPGGVIPKEIEPLSVSKAAELKAAGFDAAEIIKMKNEGVI